MTDGTDTLDDHRDVPKPLRLACAVLGVQAAALVVLAAWLLIDTAFGGAAKPVRGLLSVVFALAGAGVLLLGARGLLRLSPAARTPMIVIELLALPVAYSMAFPSDRPAWGGPIFVTAVAVLYLLFTPPVRAVLERDTSL